MSKLDSFVNWHVRGCHVGDGECTCGMEEAKAELAALRDQNQRFTEWHLEQGRMLTALRAENEEKTLALHTASEAAAKYIVRSAQLSTENEKLKKTLCLDWNDRPTQLWKLFADNERLTKAVEEAGLLIERSKWYRLHPSIRDYIEWQEKYGKDAT